MKDIDWELVEKEFDPHPDGQERYMAVMKNLAGRSLTDEDRKHLRALRRLYGIKE